MDTATSILPEGDFMQCATLDGGQTMFLLALLLDGVRGGLTYDQIRDLGVLGDPSKGDETLQRELRRHIDALAKLNVMVRVTYGEDGVRYTLDRGATFACRSQIGLDTREAIELATVLGAYLQGSRKPYADEVRAALGKIAAELGVSQHVRAARGNDSPQARREAATYAALCEALDGLHPVEVDYTNAAGATTRRKLEVMGFFERGGEVYFVARDTAKPEPPQRVFRLSRVGHKNIRVFQAESYAVPQDFRVEDHIALPFQYEGGAQTVARFAVRGIPKDELAAMTLGKGAVTQEAAGTFWTVDAADLGALASWSVAAAARGLVPVAPPQLVDAVMAGLDAAEAANAAADADATAPADAAGTKKTTGTTEAIHG